MKKQILLVGLSTLMLMACQQKPDKVSTLSGLDPVKFSTEVNHSQTNLYTLKNKSGMEVCITNFVNPEKPDVPLNKNDAFQKVQKRRVQEKR